MKFLELTRQKVEKFVTGRLGITNKAFVNLIVPGIMTMIIGGVLLVVAYIVIAAVITGVGNPTNTTLNNSMWQTIGVIVQALGISAIALRIVGIAMIVYTLNGLAGGGGVGRR
jgi:ABC-type spermidine/putrescine transport system permease subunit II